MKPCGFLLQLVLFIWQLPQNLLGIILLTYLRARKRNISISYERNRCFIKGGLGISLGFFIFWFPLARPREPSAYTCNKEHEFGHSLQSLLFGPLYLLVIGLPSASRALYARYYQSSTGRWWPRYYSGYPERWADSLGQVDSQQERHVWRVHIDDGNKRNRKGRLR